MKKEMVLLYEWPWCDFLSSSPFMVHWQGQDWMTAEHAYQAAKFTDSEIVEKIRAARSVYDCEEIVRKHRDEVRTDWLEVEESTLEEITLAKLDQHYCLRKRLLDTGTMEIIDNNPQNGVWHWGINWIGKNPLGKVLMKLREKKSWESFYARTQIAVLQAA